MTLRQKEIKTRCEKKDDTHINACSRGELLVQQVGEKEFFSSQFGLMFARQGLKKGTVAGFLLIINFSLNFFFCSSCLNNADDSVQMAEQRVVRIQTLSWARSPRFERLPDALFGRYAALLPAHCSSERGATNT